MSPTCSEVLPHKVEQLLEGGDVQSLDSDSEEERLGEVHPLSQHPSQQVNLLSVLSLEKEEKMSLPAVFRIWIQGPSGSGSKDLKKVKNVNNLNINYFYKILSFNGHLSMDFFR